MGKRLLQTARYLKIETGASLSKGFALTDEINLTARSFEHGKNLYRL